MVPVDDKAVRCLQDSRGCCARHTLSTHVDHRVHVCLHACIAECMLTLLTPGLSCCVLQVKGLSSRKTLGQWLDERGVTAKPRLTLADQVQQHTVGTSRASRGGAAGGAAAAAAGLAAARGAAGSGDLSGAVAGAVRMNSGVGSGLRRSSGHDNWNRSTGGGAAVSDCSGDKGILACDPVACPAWACDCCVGHRLSCWCADP